MGIFAIFLILVIISLVSWFLITYNALIRVKENIKKAWGNIDVLLMQRSDEIPKLIETVKAFRDHEKEMFNNVLNARDNYLNANTISEKATADSEITTALKSIFSLSESYPELKSSDNFLQFQNRISSIEEKIADRREFYNESVNNYNISIQSLPDVVIANILSLKQEEMFKVPESKKKDVEINF